MVLQVCRRHHRLRSPPQHLEGALFKKVCYYKIVEEDGEVEIAIQCNTGYYEGVHGYANGISTIEGGTHVEGFKKALTGGSQQVRPCQRTAEREGGEPSR